jgi:hypothetical protein
LGDSAKDLTGYMRGKKIIRLVDSPDATTIIVRITDRTSASDAGSVITAPAPNVAVAIPIEGTTLRAVLLIGDFKQEFVTAGEGSWRLAARRMAQEIDRWVIANADRLRNK